ncbi:MAG: UvrD-helicase domain-containing protein [Elusimicrobia bacterium]|nr:UvrD-helicase domain-containing protein [Elusimicrobiota bacterium]
MDSVSVLNNFNTIDLQNLPPDITLLYNQRISDLNENQKIIFDNALSQSKSVQTVKQLLTISQRLNPEQLEAVFHHHKTAGPLLIFACAGSGKTTALTYRIIYLILYGVNPQNILALTFTVKAAEEMRNRIKKFFVSIKEEIPEEKYLAWEEQISKMWVGTFHSVCLKILKEESPTDDGRTWLNAERVSIPAGFKILENPYKVLKPCFDLEFSTDPNVKYDDVAMKIEHWKNELINLENIRKRATKEEQKIVPVYERYQNTLKQQGLIDFNDMMMLVVDLFDKFPTVLSWYQRRFKYILVDEYQDTNYAQYILCKKLVGKSENLFVVGDDDQSIYAWRGADIRNILFFEKDYPNCTNIKLVKNYRSTATIITAANEVFKKYKPKHLVKTIEPIKRKSDGSLEFGDAITVYKAKDETDEINFCVFEMERIKQKDSNLKWNDFAILYRTHEQSKVTKKILESKKIPYIIYNPHFWQRKEVQDITAYLKVLDFYIKLQKKVFEEPMPMIAIEGSSIEGDIKRLYYLPPVMFSAIEVEIMSHIFNPYKLFTDGKVLEDMLRRLIDENSKKKFLKLFEIFFDIADSEPQMSLSDAIGYILEKGGYLSLYQKGAFQTEQEKETVRFALAVKEEAADFERVRGGNLPLHEKIDMFIESIAMRGKSTEQSALKTVDDYVNVMSLHAAKGLEFNTVFFIGLEENIIPIKHFSEEKISKKDKEKQLDEERRLFYVGITRAKERLFLTYADTRKWYGKPQQFEPSQFLRCLPGKLLDKGSFAVGFWEKFKYFLVKVFR